MISELSLSDPLHPFNSDALDGLLFHIMTTRNPEFYAGTHEELTPVEDLATDEVISLFEEAWQRDLAEIDGQRTYPVWKLTRRFMLSGYDLNAIGHLSTMALRGVYRGEVVEA